MGAKFEAIKHATSTGIMWHCENNLEQGSRIQDIDNNYVGTVPEVFNQAIPIIERNTKNEIQ